MLKSKCRWTQKKIKKNVCRIRIRGEILKGLVCRQTKTCRQPLFWKRWNKTTMTNRWRASIKSMKKKMLQILQKKPIMHRGLTKSTISEFKTTSNRKCKRCQWSIVKRWRTLSQLLSIRRKTLRTWSWRSRISWWTTTTFRKYKLRSETHLERSY